LASQITVDGDITIDGQDRNITISGDNNNDGIGDTRIFYQLNGPAHLKNITLTKGFSDNGGCINAESIEVTNCTFRYCKATNDGGAIYLRNESTRSSTITNTVLTDNEAGNDGGGIYASSAPMEVYESQILNNTAGSGGGGLVAWNDIVTNSLLEGNRAGDGGGGIVGGQKVSHTRVLDNWAGFCGGGITAVDTIEFSEISGNETDCWGGGICNFVNVSHSTLANNYARCGGGGLYHNLGSATVSNSTLTQNLSYNGGGLLSHNDVTVRNSTFYDNEAITANRGGGIFAERSHKLVLENTLIAASTNTDCVYGGTLSSVGNLIQDGTCSPSLSGDPKLGPLQDNGGPTETMALLMGSKAIDAGNDAKCDATDQRGYGRPDDGDGDTFVQCDIGAFEVQRIIANLVRNGDFEDGTQAWRFYTNGEGSLTTQGDSVYSGAMAAHIHLRQEGSNVQLYQTNITLEPNQRYRLHFAAKSSDGQNMAVYIHKHEAPYTNYGLVKLDVPLETAWKAFDMEFTTRGFDATVSDARLRFYFGPYDSDNSSYEIDHVVLQNITNGTPPPPEPLPVPPAWTPSPCEPDSRNALSNPGFEDGTKAWKFYTNGDGRFWSAASAFVTYQCQSEAHVIVVDSGTNTQLYQEGIALQPRTAYRLIFYSSSEDYPQKIKLYLHKHTAPYTNYGLNGLEVTLDNQAEVFVHRIDFTTTNFSEPVNDARLRLWLAPIEGQAYLHFDDFVLMPAAEFNALGITETATSFNVLGIDALMQRNDKSSGKTMEVLTSGYFIDDDDAGRMAGAVLPLNENQSPVCEQASTTPDLLWPANHKLISVQVIGVTDPDGDPVRVTISSIRQDEPVSGTDKGDKSPDGYGLGRARAQLRAERDGTSNGRVYHIGFTADDGRGGTCTGEITSGVPHSEGEVPVDEGPLYDSANR